jgi:hypothetical protein
MISKIRTCFRGKMLPNKVKIKKKLFLKVEVPFFEFFYLNFLGAFVFYLRQVWIFKVSIKFVIFKYPKWPISIAWQKIVKPLTVC